jgi:hypothetical protein
LEFEHDRVDVTHWRAQFTLDGTSTVAWAGEVPLAAAAVVSGQTHRLPLAVFPALPVGTTWRAALAAVNNAVYPPEVCATTPALCVSALAVAPETFRYQACADATGVHPLTPTLPTTLPTWRVGQRVALPVTYAGGVGAVVGVEVDLTEDGQPAWYFAGAALGTHPAVLVGPVSRARTYTLVVRATTAVGCRGVSASRPVVVLP